GALLGSVRPAGQPGGGVPGVVDHRGERVPDRAAENAGEDQSTPFFWAIAMLCSCSASVSAKAVVPFLSITTKYSQLAEVGFIAACSAALLGLSIGPSGNPGCPTLVFHGFFGSLSSSGVRSLDGFFGLPCFSSQ